MIGVVDVLFVPNLIELEPAEIEALSRFDWFSLNDVPMLNEEEVKGGGGGDLSELDDDPGFGVIQHTQFVLSESFDTRHVSHVHLEVEDRGGLSWPVRVSFADNRTAGFAVIQHTHLSFVSEFDTKHVSHFHFVVVVVLLFSAASGF